MLINTYPSVIIVVATYNGVKYIDKQLDSLLAQTTHCSIYIFDDGSTDGTVELIRSNYLHKKNIFLTENTTRLGYVENFEQAIIKAYNLGAQYIALCDQDDIWESTRIEKNLSILTPAGSDIPILVYSDLQMIDANGTPIAPSYIQFRNYSNRSKSNVNALAICLGQNGVMGNTILMNRALAKQATPFPKSLKSHDYWISLVAQLYGQCLYIPTPLVKYRIHSNNTSNSSSTLEKPHSTSKEGALHNFLKRDYRLPYKEDSRVKVLEEVIALSSFLYLPLSKKDRELISGFIHYLKFDKPRPYIAYWMLKHRFIKKGFKHKLYFVYKLLTTKRYPRK